MIFAVIAVIVLLLILLVWVNVKMMGPKTEPTTTAAVSEEGMPSSDDRFPHPHPAEDGEAMQQQPSPSTSPVGPAPRQEAEVPVEILRTSPKSKTPFDKPLYPFKLMEMSVPEFATDAWKHCFQQLTDDQRVLGWIAFQGERMGASDVDYDAKFVDVLRSYHRTLESLRQEVGMSAIHESSVIGAEGKVWFLTAVGDSWLALFLDRQTDPHWVSERLLQPLQAQLED